MIGKTISHYKILEKIGGGGMGEVYKAEDTKLKRTIAIKFLPRDMTRDSDAKRRFIQEAQLASSLDHPNICTIHEIDETKDGQLFICMACYEGESLKDIIKRGPLDFDKAIEIALHVAQGLAKAHAQKILHRDIKPANIFITNDGQVKILDFGLAKLAGQTKVTRSGTTLGTVAYMSPEQARGVDVDHRTDIWSLGVILYEMITGQLPFRGEHEEAVLYSIFNDEPLSMKEKRSDVPKPLEGVVMRMLQKNPEERHVDTNALISDLKSVASASPQVTVSQPYLARIIQTTLKRKSIKNTVISVFVLAVLVIVFFSVRSKLFPRAMEVRQTSIAVIPFKNRTGDSSFDYLCEAIPNLLITNLEQSEYLSVMTWERMYDLLRAAGKEDMRSMAETQGFELCQVGGVEALVVGDFTKSGNTFITDVKVLDVDTKELLKTVSSKGAGVASVLKNQVDELSKDISRVVGISERKIAAQKSIADVTTSSMEAYNYFLRGRVDFEKQYYNDAGRFLEKAVELDSTFAMAHVYLAATYAMLGNTAAERAAYEKANTFMDKATSKERLYIEASYASSIEQNQEKQLSILKKIANKYPKEKRAHYALAGCYGRKGLLHETIEEYNKTLELDPSFGPALNELAFLYADIGNYEKAIAFLEKYASASPGDANPFDSMGELYLKMGQLNQALMKYNEALDVKPDFIETYYRIAYIYALKEDYREAVKWVERFIGAAQSPGTKAEAYWWRGLYNYWLGDLGQSLSDLRKAETLFKSVENVEAASIDWTRGWIYHDVGNLEQGWQHFEDWFDLAKESMPDYRPTYQAYRSFYLGLTNIKNGEIVAARSNLAELKSLLSAMPQDLKDWPAFYYQLLYAEVLLAADSIEKAVIVGKEVASWKRSFYMHTGSIVPYNAPFRRDILARIYLKKNDLDNAIDEYERLITFDPTTKDRTLIHPIYHYTLATLYEEKGLKEKAIQAYKKFLEIWKDADKDQPKLIDAKTRLARIDVN